MALPPYSLAIFRGRAPQKGWGSRNGWNLLKWLTRLTSNTLSQLTNRVHADIKTLFSSTIQHLQRPTSMVFKDSI